MNLFLVAGVIMLGVGFVGYGAGIMMPYPARELSVPAIMIGIALLSMRKVTADSEVSS